MATKDMGYDHQVYLTRFMGNGGEVGGGATTQYAKFAAFCAQKAFAAQLTVTTAGTSTAHTVAIIKISGTATSTLGVSTLGTLAAGGTRNVLLNTAAAGGGADVLQGDIIAALTGADATGRAAIGFEMGITPQASITL